MSIDSDIENATSDFRSSFYDNVPTPYSFQNVNPLVPRHERAPLETSNTCNFAYNCPTLPPATAKWQYSSSLNDLDSCQGGEICSEDWIKYAARQKVNDTATTKSDIKLTSNDYSTHSYITGEVVENNIDTTSTVQFLNFTPHEREVLGPISARKSAIQKSLEAQFLMESLEKVDDNFERCSSHYFTSFEFLEEILDMDQEAGFGEEEGCGLDDVAGFLSVDRIDYAGEAVTGDVPVHGDMQVENEATAVRKEVREFRGELRDFLSERRKVFATVDSMGDVIKPSLVIPPARYSESVIRHTKQSLPNRSSKFAADLSVRTVVDASSRMKPIDLMLDAVESKVDLEQEIDELRMSRNSEEHFTHKDQIRDWVRPRWDQHLKKEVQKWKDKARNHEQELKQEPAEKSSTMRTEQADVDKDSQSKLQQLTEPGEIKIGKVAKDTRSVHEDKNFVSTGFSRKLEQSCYFDDPVIKTFNISLAKPDDGAERNTQAVRGIVHTSDVGEVAVLQHQNQWSTSEKHLQCQLLSLKVKFRKVSNELRGTRRALAAERGLRKESQLVVERTLKLWTEDKQYLEELERKIQQLETELENADLRERQREADIMQERKACLEELAACRLVCEEEIDKFKSAFNKGYLLHEQGERWHALIGFVNCDDAAPTRDLMVELELQDGSQEQKSGVQLVVQEQQLLEKNILEAFMLIKGLKKELDMRDHLLELQKKELESAIIAKGAEIEKLIGKLYAKEHELEVTVQKFNDEILLIDKEVRKERIEREHVMELHFTSKRKLVLEWKEREETLLTELESTTRELHDMRLGFFKKEEEFVRVNNELHETLAQLVEERMAHAPVAEAIMPNISPPGIDMMQDTDNLAVEMVKDREVAAKPVEDMLAEMWKFCEDQNMSTELSLKPMLECLQLGYTQADAMTGKIPVKCHVDSTAVNQSNRQVSSMHELLTFQNEMQDENKQLTAALAMPKVASVIEYQDWQQKEMVSLLEFQNKNLLEEVAECQVKQQQIIKEKDELEKVHQVEKEEAAEIITNLQAAVKDWGICNRINLTKGKEVKDNSAERSELGLFSTDSELVKVHASYLEEIDRYVLELEDRMKESERNLRSAEAVLAVRNLRQPKGSVDTDAVELEEDKDVPTPEATLRPRCVVGGEDSRFLSPFTSGDWRSQRRLLCKDRARPSDKNMILTVNGLSTSPRGPDWVEGANPQLGVWQVEEYNSSLNSIAGPSMIQSEIPQGTLAAEDFCFRERLALSSPPTPFQHQRKWVVDAGWLKQVRKEHAALRQQLHVEQQRLYNLGQVEAENRWMESAIVRALEFKRCSDAKVADLERKMALLEVMVPKNKVSGI